MNVTATPYLPYRGNTDAAIQQVVIVQHDFPMLEHPLLKGSTSFIGKILLPQGYKQHTQNILNLEPRFNELREILSEDGEWNTDVEKSETLARTIIAYLRLESLQSITVTEDNGYYIKWIDKKNNTFVIIAYSDNFVKFFNASSDKKTKYVIDGEWENIKDTLKNIVS